MLYDSDPQKIAGEDLNEIFVNCINVDRILFTS